MTNRPSAIKNLTQAQQAVERADLAASEARAERDRLVRQARVEGRTIYAMALELGVTQNAVRRMLGLRTVNFVASSPGGRPSPAPSDLG